MPEVRSDCHPVVSRARADWESDDDRRVHWPVLPQYHHVVLSDVVPDLPDSCPRSDRTAIQWSHVRALIGNRMMIGVYIGQFCLNTITWFFLTWFPTYLIHARGQIGLPSSGLTCAR